MRLVKDDEKQLAITQLPQVEGALVSLVPQDGAIRALVSGFDFNKNKFNHVTQAWRQPGSSFKPFIYSAALDKGLGPATVISDAPLYFAAEHPGGQAWEPKDDDPARRPDVDAHRPCRRSKNLVSIRILSFIGTNYAAAITSREVRLRSRQDAAVPAAGARRGPRHAAAAWRARIRCSRTAAIASIRT